MARITNIHSHIFNGPCAPDYFLKVALPRPLQPFAEGIKALLQNDWIRTLTHKAAIGFNYGHLARYIQFIDIGTQNAQEDVFLRMRECYTSLDREVRFIALTLNMDHMDVLPSGHARIEDQLAEIERVRQHYRDLLFPFVGVDPRHEGGQELVRWVSEKIERRAFFGIKLYPSLGFFPFDPRLDALYAWAEQNQVPVMTHCTRSGSHYTGGMREAVPLLNPDSLNPGHASMKNIYDRIEIFMKTPLTLNDPKYGCNIFLHPENYVPVLQKYPNLKICFAHFGGSNEILGVPHPVVQAGLDPTNWHELVKAAIAGYPQVYTDISYTLAEKKVFTKVNDFLLGPYGDRLLFGTDYFMTLQERSEASLWQQCIMHMGTHAFKRIACVNTDNYLRSLHFVPEMRFE